MNPSLILFSIQSVLRIGKIGKNALDQHARDAEVIFPNIRRPDFKRKTYVNGFFGSTNYQHFVEGDAALYADHWSSNGVLDNLNSIDVLFAAAVQIKTQEGIDLNKWITDSQVIAGATLIEQWDPEKAPLSPFARIILSAGDIALEYVSLNPGLFNIGGNGDKLIRAFAANLSKALPNDGQFGENDKFNQRLLGVFLRAGLNTLHQNPSWVVSETHLQNLISASVKPVVDALPGTISEQLNYKEVADALMGPAASAAMQTIVAHPDAFFGKDFRTETIIGEMTKALLEQASATGLEHQFTKDGIVSLYKAAIEVAAKKPHLFLKDNGDVKDAVVQELIANLAHVLKHAPSPFDGNVGLELAGVALNVISSNAHKLAAQDNPWEELAADILENVTRQLSDALEANKNLEKIFSKSQLIELGRIVVNHAAETPEMVIGHNDAVSQLVATLAWAMAKDEKLLLGGDDWLEIAKIVAQEAAANPARLFKLDPDNPDQTLAAKLIGGVLKSACTIIDKDSMKEKTVLFGNTLSEAIVILLHATAGNEEAARKYLSGIEKLIGELNTLAIENSDKFGSKEWLHLFRVLLATVLDGTEIENITIETANNILKGIL
jgi:hypothetical protein